MAWRVARSLDTLLHQINTRYPDRSKASDGSIGDAAHASRTSDHNPWHIVAGVGVVTARDFTHDPAHGVDIDRLTDELAASRDPRIKYVIANGWILDSRPGHQPWRWVRYSGTNPHTKHFHLSVMPALCDDTRSWNLPSLTGPAPNHPQEDDMQPDERNATISTHGALFYGAGDSPLEVGMLHAVAEIRDRVRAQDAQLAGLTAAVAALSDDTTLDQAAVERIIRDAVQQSIQITGTVEITGGAA